MADPAPRRGIPLRALIPNAVTVLALCFGLTGVRFAIGGEWEKAVGAILLAGVLDGIDGRIARLLKGTSRFGAELDSLSDVTAFGVAPALVLYLWALQHLPGRLGWVLALSHAIACALRLARFNAQIDAADQPHKKAGFLTGIPAPVGAGLTLAPLYVHFWLAPLEDTALRASVVAVTAPLVAFLMVSSLPSYSWGSLRLRPSWRLPALAGIGLFAGALFTNPWATLSLLTIAYTASLPLAVRAYARVKARVAAARLGSGAGDGIQPRA
ncbi:CDP-alcohol phosphatidyltransferase family protein [Sandarakinorhabdus rubra]|uniref:CDP-alcohol phosphatidyltransferase family protein n=1 Tax=Sandarakinorhabdus rubra TaxID=2672568 RepID=UPI0013D9C2B5|nr:phosphatidylcholine/phosphatidylserine synthase [Sandarakinorhabdus rubra]